MASVGERIRNERESRNTTLDDMSVATGIGQIYLESLEKGEYHELPGPAFGKLYIRAYAEVLGFDPQPWIEDYDREHRLLLGPESTAPVRTGARPMADAIARWRESKMAAEQPETDLEPEPEPEPEPQPQPEPEPEPEPMRLQELTIPPPPEVVRVPTRRILVPSLVVIAFAIVAGLIFRGVDRSAPAKPAAAAPTEIATTPQDTPLPTPPAPSPPPPTKPVTSPVVKISTPSADLTVTEFGVGRRIVNFKLEGESDTFGLGDRVSCSSRVLGGKRGNVIRHVWIYEGRAQQSITLRLGGSDYRTHTNKTVGKAGAWAVEARDDKGRLLARTEFTVEPRSR